MASRMPEVHWIRDCLELKCRRYRFLPAVEMLSMFCRGRSSVDLVGKDSIWDASAYSFRHHTGRLQSDSIPF